MRGGRGPRGDVSRIPGGAAGNDLTLSLPALFRGRLVLRFLAREVAPERGRVLLFGEEAAERRPQTTWNFGEIFCRHCVTAPTSKAGKKRGKRTQSRLRL